MERFGIPARFYFDDALERHAVVRFLSGAIEAMLGGWDHSRTLAVLRLAPRFADFAPADRFDFDVREQVPNAGLSGLRALLLGDEGQPRPGADRLLHKLDSLAALEEWRAFALTPRDWADRFSTLRTLFRPAPPAASGTHEMALQWRSQSTALGLFDEALAEASAALDAGREIGIGEYWRAVKSVLRLKPLRLEDGRRNVVHVMSAHEARQWVLPVVFVCGMVERQFPQFHKQDPFFPDTARCRVNAAGIRVRTASEFAREERALFDTATSRATMLTTLSYPEFDARGERNLPSIYLEDVLAPAVDSVPVRPAPRTIHQPRGFAQIGAPDLLDYLRTRTARLSATALETFLQCPFQYFTQRLMRLKTAPPRPEERLSFLEQGNIVHQVLAEWWQQPQDVTPLFERIFARRLEEAHIPNGYHTERLRNTMLDDLKRFTSQDLWPRRDWQSQTEIAFAFPLAEGLEISGRIDRLDVAPDGRAFVLDYKYSAAQRVKDKLKNENLMQAPLYMLAAEHLNSQASGMFYVGVKGGIEYAGWSVDPSMNGARATRKLAADHAGAHPAPSGGDTRRAHRDPSRRPGQLPLLRCEGHLPHRSGRRHDSGGGRMSGVSFTPDQLAAIDVAQRDIDACVVAGPGSGKTTVLVEYFRQLVGAGVDPLRILAITFTEKAAGNMRKKLAQAFQEQPETRANLERAWVSTVHGFCARLLRENAVFAGIDPEFGVLDATQSWRMQQESMRGAIDALFAERREGMRGLIRGLSNFEFEQAVLSAYDTMRGAGVGVEQLCGFPAPAGVTLDEINATLNAIRNESLSAWSFAQKEHLETALEGAERILSADSPLGALQAIAAFACNLQKCKRGNNAYNLLQRMREQIKEAEYTLITALYAPQRELLIETLRRFDHLYRERKELAGALDFADLEEFTVRLLAENAETRARLRRQFDHILMDEFQDTNGQQARLIELIRPARPLLRRWRHQSIHLRLPPRGTGRLHRLPRRRRGARPPPGPTGGQLPKPRRNPARRGDHHRRGSGN